MNKQELSIGLTLGAGAMVAMLIILIAHNLTREPIRESKQQKLQQQLSQLLLPETYDNQPAESVTYVTSEALGSEDTYPVYLATLKNKNTGVVVAATAADGYNGDIDLLIGLSENGSVTGVRVTQHNETPGLGDDIEINKSNWVLSFNELKTGAMAEHDWHVKKDGGKFDQFTGATITPRAVVHAVHRVVRWHQTDGRAQLQNNTSNPCANTSC